jgi:uncharacterized protein (TIGR00255 family)
MTGHGQASKRHGQATIDVEVRTVNNRYFKIVSKLSDRISRLEPELEGIVRDIVKRGTVSLSVRLNTSAGSDSSRLNQAILQSYIVEAKRAADGCMVPYQIELGSFLQLPGVLENQTQVEDVELNESVRETLKNALIDLQRMRRIEGASMASKFQENLDLISKHRDQVQLRAPTVVSDYRLKLEQRVRAAVEDRGLGLGELDLTREVVLFCDRADISEELTRLESHLRQFYGLLDSEESQGRRIDFLLQEMGRETNTIGSKANDSEISSNVVAIKAILEQIRELAQNIE